MNYKNLNTIERGKIEVLNNSCCSIRETANISNPNHSTISRELKRIDLDYTLDKSQNVLNMVQKGNLAMN
ncbi:helix-turn-helix domain-containing protein [uncultured Clostridium sp.]|jgi:IS30 family transposase|uniref:helix-turn-helix domain-containing protein n=1 Tax=uncultured Clostridium sp. TaxID=59620 RepID=UPI00261A9D47|nr:helix-turn-helix domain-containing protein [uncultured Clostridium sp.]